MGTAIAHAQPRLPSWSCRTFTRDRLVVSAARPLNRSASGAAGRIGGDAEVRRPGPGEATRARQVPAGRPDRRRASRPRRRLRPGHGGRLHRVGRDRRGAGRDRRRVVLASSWPPSARSRSPTASRWTSTARCASPRPRRDGAGRSSCLSRSPATCPAVRAEDLDEALGAVAPGEPAYVADADGLGTTLYTAAYDAFDPRFGPGSRAGPRRHRGAGDHGAAAPAAPRRRRPASDLDDALALGVGPADSRTGRLPLGRRPVLGAGSALLRGLLGRCLLRGRLLGRAFLAGAFFAGAFFAGAFLAGAFLAGAFLAGAFFAAPSWPVPSSPAPSWPAPSSPAPSWPEPSSPEPSWPEPSSRPPSWPSTSWQRPSWPVPSSRPSWQSSWSSSSSPGQPQRPPERPGRGGLERELRQLLGARDDVLQVLAGSELRHLRRLCLDPLAGPWVADHACVADSLLEGAEARDGDLLTLGHLTA